MRAGLGFGFGPPDQGGSGALRAPLAVPIIAVDLS